MSKALFVRKISERTCLWTLHPTSNTRHVKLQCPNTSPSASGACSAEWRQQGNGQFGLNYRHDSLEHQLSSKTTFCQLRLFAAYFISLSGAIGVILSYNSYLLPWMGQAFDNKVMNQSVCFTFSGLNFCHLVLELLHLELASKSFHQTHHAIVISTSRNHT